MPQSAALLITKPIFAFGFIIFISTIALSAAFISEGFLDLEPCILCIYQRYPFALAILIGILGLTLKQNQRIIKPALILCAVNFIANSAIAFYHTGVEQKWWTSAVEGCSVPLFFQDNSEKSLLENLMSAPGGSCSEIPWQDPLLGLSMANYNIALCFGLFIFCMLTAFKVNVEKSSE